MKSCSFAGIKAWLAALIILIFASACHSAGVHSGIYLDAIKLPPGFKITIYADKLPDARSMAMSPKGTLFVGTRKEGKIYAVTDRNGDQRADEINTIAERLTMPNGVAFRNGSLYIAEVDRILRYDNSEIIIQCSALNVRCSAFNQLPPTSNLKRSASPAADGY